MKLYATPLSHFARKVRILLNLYKIDYEMVDIGNVASSSAEDFAHNPLMKVPTLKCDGQLIFDSDNIAAFIVRKFDPDDRFNFFTTNLNDLNARAVMNGIMNEEVKIILAKRTGVPTEQYDFFAKAHKSIEQGLEWLEENHMIFSKSQLTYAEVHLICLIEHLRKYKMVPKKFERIDEIVDQHSLNQVISRSHP